MLWMIEYIEIEYVDFKELQSFLKLEDGLLLRQRVTTFTLKNFNFLITRRHLNTRKSKIVPYWFRRVKKSNER